jgi:hypothetical protein
MICRQFAVLMGSPRAWEELTRAERSALSRHGLACGDCLRMAAAMFAQELTTDPDRFIGDVGAGYLQSQADRATGDPECDAPVWLKKPGA